MMVTKIELPLIVALTNTNKKEVVKFMPYRENFEITLEPGDTVTLSIRTAEQGLYYLEQANKRIGLSTEIFYGEDAGDFDGNIEDPETLVKEIAALQKKAKQHDTDIKTLSENDAEQDTAIAELKQSIKDLNVKVTAINLDAFKKQIEDLDKALTAEVTRAKNAENTIKDDLTAKITTVDNKISNEILTRESDIQKLEKALEKEIADRKKADEDLDGGNSGLTQEIQDRKDADTTLQTNITKEETDRKSEIERVEGLIEKEVEDRANADTALHTTISTEIDNKIAGANATLAKTINDEISDRQSEITRVEGLITAEETARTSAINDLTTSVNDLSDKVDAIDLSSINDDITALKAKDSSLDSDISDINDNITAINTSITGINNDIEELNQKIDNFNPDTITEEEVDSKVAAEKSERTEEDTRIEGLITKEISDREDAISDINDKIDNLDLITSEDVDAKVTAHNESEDAHEDIRTKITSIKTDVEQNADDIESIKTDIYADDELNIYKKDETDTKISEAVATEATARETADTQLADDLASEVERVEGLISSETEAREAAIEEVKGLITEYELPQASTTTLGGVKVDGTTIKISESGVISALGAEGESSVVEEDITANTDVGGIVSGQVITQGTNLTQFVKSIITKKIAPELTIIVDKPLINKKGTTITAPITITATSVKKSSDITLTNIMYQDNVVAMGSETDGETLTYELETNITTNATVTANTVTDDNQSVSKSLTFEFINPYYYGISETSTIDSDNLTEELEKKNTSKVVSYTADGEYLVFMYDASYGNLSSIKDRNNFENIDNWTKTSYTLDGQTFNLYITNDKITCDNFTYTFII